MNSSDIKNYSPMVSGSFMPSLKVYAPEKLKEFRVSLIFY